MTISDFEWICVQKDKLRDTKTTTWTDKHVPISASTSSNLIEKPMFSCNSNPGVSVESIFNALDGLATNSKAQMKLKFLVIETSVKSQVDLFFSAVNQCRCDKKPVLEFEVGCIEEK